MDKIETAEQYREALGRLDEIWDAQEGTAEFEELRALVELVFTYEDEHWPILED